MTYVVLAFVLSFIQNFIATLEVYHISKANEFRATALAACSSLAAYAIVVLIVVQPDRVPLIIAGIAGDVLATSLALKKVKRGKGHN